MTVYRDLAVEDRWNAPICAVRYGCRFASPASVMECWIAVADEGDRRVVRLVGRLSAAQVPELLETCAVARPLQLDLADLVSADMAGIEALQRIRARGATLVAVPGYIQLKLDSPSTTSRGLT